MWFECFGFLQSSYCNSLPLLWCVIEGILDGDDDNDDGAAGFVSVGRCVARSHLAKGGCCLWPPFWGICL